MINLRTELGQIRAIKDDYNILSRIKNPSTRVQRVAVSVNGMALKYINNPTKDMLNEAIENNPLCIKYWENQTDDTCLNAVRLNGLALEFVKNKTSKICCEAILNNGQAIKFVPKKTEELFLIAFNRDKNIINSLKNYYPSLAKHLIRKYPKTILYVNTTVDTF